ncbi:HAD-IIB family hydrolase [Atopobium fossor]|uniref:HAD-IIB family hydrolase n=1 Tax=Atopobium fossor TaxID=39487 RepID=UPI000422E471|nr:HAD-IIB family hydrolase [Atopobium fossor]
MSLQANPYSLMVFSDMDGTFVSDDKNVPVHNLDSLTELYHAGGCFVPCTGRPMSGLLPLLLEHPSTQYAICNNGAQVLEVTHNTAGVQLNSLHEVNLGHERAHELMDVFEQLDVIVDIFTKSHALEAQTDSAHLHEFIHDPHVLVLARQLRKSVDVATYHELVDACDTVARISVIFRDSKTAQFVRDFVAQDARLACVSSADWNIEISDASSTKGAALSWLCKHVSQDLSYCVAFGDSFNDVSMLEVAGNGVAMANSMDGVFPYANTRLAWTNNEAGVGRYLNQLLTDL